MRWDVPINDGLLDQDSMDEWFKFFNEKGMEVLLCLIKRKQRKLSNINKQIAECKNILEGYKDSVSFTTLTNQLNKVLEQKDIEIKQRKKRKYLRDTNYYKLVQAFKWQFNLKDGRGGSMATSPKREVRIMSPRRDLR